MPAGISTWSAEAVAVVTFSELPLTEWWPLPPPPPPPPAPPPPNAAVSDPRRSLSRVMTDNWDPAGVRGGMDGVAV